MSSVITKKNFRENLSKDISREEAEKAVESLIRWAGDDPTREGLKETPKRVVRAFEDFFLVTRNLLKTFFQKPSKMFKVMKT